MGTRINVLLDHRINDYKDRAALLFRLSRTTEEALAVHNYWVGAVEDYRFAEGKEPTWTADSEIAIFSHQSYTGPGSLYVSVNRHTAKIRTGGRWRGFLSIPGLYAVHLRAFRAIADALGAGAMVCFPDNDNLFDMFYGGRRLGECVKNLEDTAGSPQPSIDAIAPEIAAATEQGVPDVWYIDKRVAV